MNVRSWSCLVLTVAVMGCGASTRLAAATEVTDRRARRVEIEAGRHRFLPNEMRASVGETVSLVFMRTDDESCLQRVVLYLDGDRRIERDLPMRQPVLITLRLDRAGDVGITCAKGGHGAALIVEP